MKLFFSILLSFILTASIVKAQPGSLDFSFSTEFDFQNGFISATSVQPDGKIIIAGSIQNPFSVNEFPHILRLNRDGKVDLGYKIGKGFNQTIYSLAFQKDGKLLVGGRFTKFNNQVRYCIARLNIDGSLDTTFNPPNVSYAASSIIITEDQRIFAIKDFSSIQLYSPNGNRVNYFTPSQITNTINSISLQPDGKLIIGGNFTKINNSNFKCIARINLNGTLDTTFNANNKLNLNGNIYKIKLQDDGKILLGGLFKSNQNPNVSNLVRLNANGSLDTTFMLGMTFPKDAGFINAIYIQKDGKIMVGGGFRGFNKFNNINNLLRLNIDGSLDTTFKVGDGFDNFVIDFGLQNEDKLIVVGDFNSYDSYLINRIARINLTNGTELSITLSPNPNFGNFRVNASKVIESLSIFDSYGNEIFKAMPNLMNIDIDLKSQSAGLYYITLISGNQIGKQKFLKL